ncbi:MAG: NAD(P)-dependent oxidoreductase [Actinomycetia bacterium]|nr:NAD(P)-dependent oxidoreductase [Actinomycetes bacterium]
MSGDLGNKGASMLPAEFTRSTALVTGASRGFGRAIATELSANGVTVVGVARHAEPLDELHDELGDQFVPVVGDVTNADLARNLIEEHSPRILVLNAGATPVMGCLREHTWESFSRNWEVDTQHAFHWTREALRLPLAPGSVVIALSSGAALRGSPLSGGYAGAKAAVRFISAYAAEESRRDNLGIRFVALLPQLTPVTDLGDGAVAAYAAHEGIDVDTYLQRFQPILRPERVGKAIVELSRDAEPGNEQHLAYLISGAGLQEIRSP